MKIKIISGVDKPLPKWEEEINATIQDLEFNGNKVISITWQNNFASLAYNTVDDMEEMNVARKGIMGDLIGDTVKGFTGR